MNSTHGVESGGGDSQRLPQRPEAPRGWWSRIALLATSALAVTATVLVRSGVFSVATAIWVFVGFEIVLLSTLIPGIVSGMRLYRVSRIEGNTRWNAAEDGLSRLMPPLIARILLYEPRIWGSLARWSVRRIPRSADRFAYSGPLRIPFMLFISLTVFEGVIVDAILLFALGSESVWTWVALLAHIYGVIWLAGWYASCVVLPHRLEPEVLRLRDSILSEVIIPRNAIQGAHRKTVANFFRSGFKWIDKNAGHAKFTAGDGNVVITVNPAVTITANRVPHQVASIAVTAEHPDAFIAALMVSDAGGSARGEQRTEIQQ